MKRRTFLMGAAGAAACSRRPRLNVYNWSDYVAPDTIANFEHETGIEVRYGTYESVPEMLAKVMSGNSGWDVVFPSAEYIQPMREMGLLAPLHSEKLPHLDALEASFRHPPWDRDLRWSVPYMWGVTGIAYQTALHKAPESWRDLWDGRLAGKITMLDDPPEVLGACLQMLGYSLNSSRSGGAGAGAAGGHRAEAPGAGVPERGGSRSTGGGRLGRGAGLGGDRGAGDSGRAR